jgi:hypothetical protein
MPKQPLLKPGEKAPDSGQFEIRGPRGGYVGGEERTSTKGHTLPPTPQSNQRYVLVDKTNY